MHCTIPLHSTASCSLAHNFFLPSPSTSLSLSPSQNLHNVAIHIILYIIISGCKSVVFIYIYNQLNMWLDKKEEQWPCHDMNGYKQ